MDYSFIIIYRNILKTDSECDLSAIWVFPSWLLFLLQDSEANLLKDSNVQHMPVITAARLIPDELLPPSLSEAAATTKTTAARLMKLRNAWDERTFTICISWAGDICQKYTFWQSLIFMHLYGKGLKLRVKKHLESFNKNPVDSKIIKACYSHCLYLFIKININILLFSIICTNIAIQTVIFVHNFTITF